MGAPLGFKTFATGDVLTAADTNGYLMQGVWTFASAAARDAAVTSPQEGNMCYLKDTDAVQYYSGSAWTAVGGASGGMTLISTTAVTATASLDMTSIPQTYKELVIYVSGVYENSGAGQSLTWNNYTSGFSYNVIQASNANTVSVSTSSGSVNLGGSLRFVAGSGSGSMAIRIPNYTDAAMQKVCSWFMGGGNGATTGSGSYGGIAAITSVKITWAGTPTAAGNVYLYGVK
jgi:hypothetical protein